MSKTSFMRSVSFERRYGTWTGVGFGPDALVRARMHSLRDISDMLISFFCSTNSLL